MLVNFNALVKLVDRKALVSGDLSFQVVFQTEDVRAKELIHAPGDTMVAVQVALP